MGSAISNGEWSEPETPETGASGSDRTAFDGGLAKLANQVTRISHRR
jgi:hypothetical protein